MMCNIFTHGSRPASRAGDSYARHTPARTHYNACMKLRLRELREERGLTQAQLAEMAGIERSQLSKIERGKEPANTRRLETFAKVLDVGVHDLIEDDGTGDGYRRTIMQLLDQLTEAERSAISAMVQTLIASRHSDDGSK